MSNITNKGISPIERRERAQLRKSIRDLNIVFNSMGLEKLINSRKTPTPPNFNVIRKASPSPASQSTPGTPGNSRRAQAHRIIDDEGFQHPAKQQKRKHEVIEDGIPTTNRYSGLTPNTETHMEEEAAAQMEIEFKASKNNAKIKPPPIHVKESNIKTLIDLFKNDVIKSNYALKQTNFDVISILCVNQDTYQKNSRYIEN